MTATVRRHATIGLLAGLGFAATACTGGEPETLDHGVVKVEFRRAEGQSTNPYVGTVNIEITLDYLECLIAFYDNNPEYTQDGVIGLPDFGTADQGGEGWMDRLCDNDSGSAAPCNVVSIKQELVQSKHLTVVYEMTGDIEDRFVNFGPLPTDELAMCENGGQPIVRVAFNGNVRGLNGNGDQVWETVSFDPDKAFTNQGQAIEIKGGLPDPN